MERRVHIAVTLAAWMLASAVRAAEGEQSNLFAGDIDNVVWTLVIFVLVIFVLGRFAWGPLLESLQRREEFIRRSLTEAKNDREAAEARLEEYESKLAAASSEAAELIDQGRRDAQTLRARIEEQAREESDKMIERATREIDLAKQTAIKDLYAISAELATQIAGRILERELSPQDHERLISESIQELDKLEKN